MKIKIKYLFLILSLLISIGIGAQEIQEHYVMDFSGGLVNSISNALMKDNQALVLENYDIDPFGNLTPMPGASYYHNDSALKLEGIISYYNQTRNKLVTIKTSEDYFTNDTAKNNIGIIRICDEASSSCSTSIYPGYYLSRNDSLYPANMSYTFDNTGNLFIAASKSEMLVYDGNYVFPARPYGPGQPRIAIIEGQGTLSGRFRYKYCYIDTTALDTSNFSPPSWQITTNAGLVVVYDFWDRIDTTRQDMILIARSHNDSNYEFVANIPGNQLEYIDSINNPAGPIVDTSDNIGVHRDCLYIYPYSPYPNDYNSNVYNDGLLAPPAGFVVKDSIINPGAYRGVFDSLPYVDCKSLLLDTLDDPHFSYMLEFVDSAGRTSYCSPMSCHKINGTYTRSNDSNIVIILDSLPVPKDSSIIKKTLIRRVLSKSIHILPPTSSCCDSIIGTWIKIEDSLPPSQTYYMDTHTIAIQTDENGYTPSEYYLAYNARYNWTNACETDWDLLYDQSAEVYFHDDSIITFQPSDIVSHLSRCYAIGHPTNRNHIYFSDYGRYTTWPSDKFIYISSQRGDWFVRILSLGESLLMFRQNSIWQLSGTSFYQYQIREIVSGVGLTAPRTLVRSNYGIFFAHKTGVYQFGEHRQAISYPIKNSIDSLTSTMRESWAENINGELWFSPPVNSPINSKTYIYSITPTPHWKCLTRGFYDAARYNNDTLALDYEPDKWILLGNNDTLYKYNYSATDTLFGLDTLIRTYQSKYFFESEDREKIYYIDLVGSGICDSMKLTFYGNYSTDFATYDTLATKIINVDFSSAERQRVKVNHICKNFSVKIQDYGMGDYKLKGYIIGWQPWDKRKVRP